MCDFTHQSRLNIKKVKNNPTNEKLSYLLIQFTRRGKDIPFVVNSSR